MSDMGFQSGQIAGVSACRKGPWLTLCMAGMVGKGCFDELVFKEYRLRQKRIMQTASVELAKKALKQIEDKLPEASAAQATVIYGILRDKERLDAGEPTEHIAHLHFHEVAEIDLLLAKLQEAKAKEITPGVR